MLPSSILRAVSRSAAISRATSAAAAEAAAASAAVDAAAARAVELAKIRDLMARYPTRKEWPPDFSELSPQHRFRFEKKWKRRLGLKAQGVGREKTTRLVQYFGMVGIAAYVFFFGEFELFGEKYRVMNEAKNDSVLCSAFSTKIRGTSGDPTVDFPPASENSQCLRYQRHRG